MKVLITGMNKNQCTENFFLKQNLKVVPSHYSLVRCLRDMGHTVEQRFVKYDENIDNYDKVIVFITSPKQLTVTNFYKGLSVISKRPDCILAYDDWQIKHLYKDLVGINEENLYNDFFINTNKETVENIKKYQEMCLDGIDVIKNNKNRILLSCFSGGDVSKIISNSNVFTYNPNPYHLNRIGKSETKERRFNFASLVQSKTAKWIKTQKTSWPIDYYGSKAKKQTRLTEKEMCNVYAKDFGCLMPGYDISGSGWWRARPLQVADVNSILIGDKEELMIYYKDEYLSSLKASDLEQLSDVELSNIANKQKEAIYRNHPLSKEVQQNELKLALSL